MRTHILYGPRDPSAPSFAMPYEKLMAMDANAKYGEHFDNLMYLEFMLNHPDTTRIEKDLAQKEIPIARRKMDWWKRHPNWDIVGATRHTTRVKRRWASK